MAYQFFILTALDVESNAIKRHLENVTPLSESPFFAGRLPVGDGNFLEILLARSRDSGTARASSLTQKALTLFKPQRVVLVGIAAGLKENGIFLGDVLIPAWIYPYEKRKRARVAGQPRVYPRDWPFQVTAGDLLDRAQQLVEADELWYQELDARRPDNKERDVPVIHTSPTSMLGSGDKILADDQAEERLYLVSTYGNDALGFEMEAAGCGQTCLQEAVPFLVVKGFKTTGPKTKTLQAKKTDGDRMQQKPLLRSPF